MFLGFLNGREKKELEVTEHKYFGRDPKTGLRVEKILKVGNHVDLGLEPVGVFFGYMKIGDKILSQFYTRHIVEKDPSIPERNPPRFREFSVGKRNDDPMDIDGIPLISVFDRIDEMNGKWFIGDYKTDKTSPELGSFVLHRNP